MSDSDEKEEPIIQRSVILLEFESPSSTNFTTQMVGVGAFQLLMLSKYFDILGRNALAQEAAVQAQKRMQEEQRSKIMTPQDVRRIERI